MDELDLLKKSWNKPQQDHKKLSVNDIYPMLHKKSSSIVKTLFYISIAEFVFWLLINAIPIFYNDEHKQKLEALYQNDTLLTAITFLTYAIILVFIYLLYKSYQSISVTDSAKKLMENILKTRKIIKYYVLYNLIMAAVSLAIGFYYVLHNDVNLTDKMAHINNWQLIALYAGIGIVIILFVGVIWLFYRLIYGLLLKRLNQNYNELKQLDN
ncbi:hypothetical protein PW52_08320 [Tamlana sedimentorum]|uniref:Beta-carotene 15,15'-monooxygenase n=1 Tax=Neotamlana sedimentorum TaxID=1435349 RepID=A0A0D7W9E9_9FLAO|nr:hypothetical protein [Tamlana sedimentorum]KJD35734.1 hypothetical protein PW52_08320 [Tamlana sedimentorum]